MLRRVSLALALVVATGSAASAQTLTPLGSDAEYDALVASGAFAPLLSAQVGGAPAPQGGSNIGVFGTPYPLYSATVSWPGAQWVRDGETFPSHEFSLSLGMDGGWFADLWLEDAHTGTGGEVTAQVLAGPGTFDTGFFDTLVLRGASASGLGMQFLSPLTLLFRGTGESIELDPFAGDADGNYLVITDPRLGYGFWLTGRAAFTPALGAESVGGAPGYAFVVGNATVSAVPEPAGVALMATGLAALGGVAARRRRAAR